LGVVGWFKFNRRCKEINRYLLAEAERIRMEPKYPPPTPEEVQDFIDWSESIGMQYKNNVEKIK
jgi:hypothetical protein